MAKFISELNLKDPQDVAEMARHVFGDHYPTDSKGRPVERGRGSPHQLKSERHPDSANAHYEAVGKYKGAAAELREREKYGAEVPDDLRARAQEEIARKQHREVMAI